MEKSLEVEEGLLEIEGKLEKVGRFICSSKGAKRLGTTSTEPWIVSGTR